MPLLVPLHGYFSTTVKGIISLQPSCIFSHQTQSNNIHPFFHLPLLPIANKIAIPLNIQYKEIKEGDFIAQLVFLNRLFYTAQSHSSERDAKQDLSRLIVWTLLGKIDHRTVSRSVPSGENVVTQVTLHSSIEAPAFSSAQSNQREPVSWADVVVRRTSLSSSTAAHPGSTDLRSESYDQSSVATNSPKTTTTTATSVTASDLASVGFLKDSGDVQPTLQFSNKLYPFPRMVSMPAALEVDDIHVDWPIARVFEHLDLGGPTKAEMEEFSSPSSSLLSDLNSGATILTSSAPSILAASTTLSSRNTSYQAFTDRRFYNAPPPPPPTSNNAISSTGWYQRDVSSRSKAFGYSNTKVRSPDSSQSNFNYKDSGSIATSSSFRYRQEPSSQMKLTSPYKASPWQGSGSQALMGLSEQTIRVKTAVTRLSDFMQLVYPNDSVIHYEQYYSSEYVYMIYMIISFFMRVCIGTMAKSSMLLLVGFELAYCAVIWENLSVVRL